MNRFDDGVDLVDCKTCKKPPITMIEKGGWTLYRVKCNACQATLSSVSQSEVERVWNAVNGDDAP